MYDAENHLRSATIRLDCDSQGFRFLSYTYDADGIRTSKTVKIGSGDPATTWYVVDKNRDYAQVLEERDASGALAVRYVYGLDLIAQVRGTNPSYYHYDGLGSTRQLTNSPVDPLTDKPVVKNSYTYEAFGRRLESGTADQVDNDYRFTGEQYDSQTSSYYLRARYYQPGTGRFTGRDAAEGYTSNPLTLHKYLYCNADPATLVDPSGYEGLGAVLVGTAIIASLNGILGGVLSGVRNGVRGAIGGFAGGVISTLIGVLGTFYVGLPTLSFGVGALIGAMVEMMITYGTEYLKTVKAWITMASAFLIGATMGYLGGAATLEIAKKLTNSILNRAAVQPLVEDIVHRQVFERGPRRVAEWMAAHPDATMRILGKYVYVSFGKAAADTLKAFFFGGGAATVTDAIADAVLKDVRTVSHALQDFTQLVNSRW